ncbi:lipopolysaccharide kinase InaA family protein [Flavobacterium sp. J27]|uniref:lipopolysaccharide kinase InaA family protein n=1 Tax=Flavobacterium sp. J27 TaxID=2060419 RepID=UPI0010304F8F|nr:lipopolysaccharide kinase InaA family protein [Flavobacterium sp. J27]
MFRIFPTYKNIKELILSSIDNFHTSGKLLAAGKRNTIKLFQVDEVLTLNIKSFKKPIVINQIIYNYFRKSKAQRSFEYASILLEKGIGTPQPIAFKTNTNFIGLQDSYYVCEHILCDLTYKELVETDYPDGENILRQFVHFTYKLHQNGIEFKDHSPGNTLIKNKHDGSYQFYLVDLNRMNFHTQMNFKTRMKNLSRLTPKKEMVMIMSNEYAKLSGEDETVVFETMWQLTTDFQKRFHRKKKLKKSIKL